MLIKLLTGRLPEQAVHRSVPYWLALKARSSIAMPYTILTIPANTIWAHAAQLAAQFRFFNNLRRFAGYSPASLAHSSISAATNSQLYINHFYKTAS